MRSRCESTRCVDTGTFSLVAMPPLRLSRIQSSYDDISSDMSNYILLFHPIPPFTIIDPFRWLPCQHHASHVFRVATTIHRATCLTTASPLPPDSSTKLALTTAVMHSCCGRSEKEKITTGANKVALFAPVVIFPSSETTRLTERWLRA